MVDCFSDASQVKNVIKSQQRKLKKEMAAILKQKATQSGYPALSRQEQRQAEYHHDRIVQEQSMQKDIKKSDRVARRIEQILDKLRRDSNKMKNHLASYHFATTTGKDSDCSGDCKFDLSTGLDTRFAWKSELERMIEQAEQYAESQYLDDYALVHIPDTTGCLTTCCSKVYRSQFCYYTPDGDCQVIPVSAGKPTGDSNSVSSGTEVVHTAQNDSNGDPKSAHERNYRDVRDQQKVNIIDFVLSASTVSDENDRKGVPVQFNAWCVSNPDLQWDALRKLTVKPSSTSGREQSVRAWISHLMLIAKELEALGVLNKFEADGTTLKDPATNEAALAEHLKCIGFSEEFVKSITVPIAVYEDDCLYKDTTDTPTDGVSQELVSVANRIIWLVVVVGDLSLSRLMVELNTEKHPFNKIGKEFEKDVTEIEKHANTSTGEATYRNPTENPKTTGVVFNKFPWICNIEDEPDLVYPARLINTMMNNLRRLQVQNDREQAIITNVREVAECNEAYHQDVFSELTAIDESELESRYAIGKELCKDLDGLYKENCVTRQSFFNDATFSGCMW